MILTPLESTANENKKLEFQKSIAFKSSGTNVMQSTRIYNSKRESNMKNKNEDEISSSSSHS
jgi:hypothetical protein